MAATWPSYAKIQLDGFTQTPDYGVVRSDMDGGVAKQRARFSKPIVRRQIKILCETRQAKLDFDVWFATDLFGGAGWFDWTDPLDGKAKKARIVGGKLEWTSPGVIWFASSQMETIG